MTDAGMDAAIILTQELTKAHEIIDRINKLVEEWIAIPTVPGDAPDESFQQGWLEAYADAADQVEHLLKDFYQPLIAPIDQKE